jgi:hypothetical protein
VYRDGRRERSEEIAMEEKNTRVNAVEVAQIVAALLTRATKVEFHQDEMCFVAFFKSFEMSGPDRMLSLRQVVELVKRDLA